MEYLNSIPEALLLNMWEKKFQAFVDWCILLELMIISLLATTIAKYGVPINQWFCLYQALLEVCVNKIPLLPMSRVDEWTAECAVIVSNEPCRWCSSREWHITRMSIILWPHQIFNFLFQLLNTNWMVPCHFTVNIRLCCLIVRSTILFHWRHFLIW